VTAQPDNRWFIVLSPEGAARAVGEDTIKAFLQCAGMNSVKVFDCRTYQKAFSSLLVKPEETMVVDLLNHALIVQCLDFRATHLLVLSLCPVTLFTLNLIKNQHIITMHWFYEDFKRAIYWKEVMAGYNYFFAIQKGPIPGICEANKSHYGFLPTAANSAAPVDQSGGHTSRFDVVFIGIPSPYRIQVLEFLSSAGISLAIAGIGWKRYRGILERFIINGDWTDARQSAEILSNSTIGLNLSVNNPEGDRENIHISPRVFDILQGGCVLVTEEVPLIHDILEGCSFHQRNTFASGKGKGLL
jgi:hypothetical protein